jgi:hypothetical protein
VGRTEGRSAFFREVPEERIVFSTGGDPDEEERASRGRDLTKLQFIHAYPGISVTNYGSGIDRHPWEVQWEVASFAGLFKEKRAQGFDTKKEAMAFARDLNRQREKR